MFLNLKTSLKAKRKKEIAKKQLKKIDLLLKFVLIMFHFNNLEY